jgi:hypothetical protein
MNWKKRLITLVAILALALALAPTEGASAQWPAPNGYVLEPDPLEFYGMGSRQTVEVQVRKVFGFFAADFTLTFDPTLIKVVGYQTGDAFDHADMSGAPQVQIGTGTVTYVNTRLGDPIPMADSLTLASITFESVSPGAVGGIINAFGVTVNVADRTGTLYPVGPIGGPYNYVMFPASGITGQALWPLPVTAGNHAWIPVQITDSAGNEIGLERTNGSGFYPATGVFPAMPANGQIRINPITSALLPWGVGRIPALETRLTNCPASANLGPHTVRLVGGDVAPIHPGVTGDNKIDISDLVLAASRFNQPAQDLNGDGWTDGDVNNNGQVNITDIVVIANNFGKNGPVCEDCP